MFCEFSRFFSDGSIAVSMVHGDVWVVRGVDETLGSLRWKRFATGLFQPLGLRIINDEVYVLGGIRSRNSSIETMMAKQTHTSRSSMATKLQNAVMITSPAWNPIPWGGSIFFMQTRACSGSIPSERIWRSWRPDFEIPMDWE